MNQPKESCVLSTFAKQPTGLRGLAFVPPVPGGFVTFSDRAAVLRLWNVSQPQPTALLKVARQSAMHSVAFLPQSTVAVCTLLDGTVALYDVQAQRKCGLWPHRLRRAHPMRSPARLLSRASRLLSLI